MIDNILKPISDTFTDKNNGNPLIDAFLTFMVECYMFVKINAMENVMVSVTMLFSAVQCTNQLSSR